MLLMMYLFLSFKLSYKSENYGTNDIRTVIVQKSSRTPTVFLKRTVLSLCTAKEIVRCPFFSVRFMFLMEVRGTFRMDDLYCLLCDIGGFLYP